MNDQGKAIFIDGLVDMARRCLNISDLEQVIDKMVTAFSGVHDSLPQDVISEIPFHPMPPRSECSNSDKKEKSVVFEDGASSSSSQTQRFTRRQLYDAQANENTIKVQVLTKRQRNAERAHIRKEEEERAEFRIN
jgi:hypothetical protein